MVRQEGSVYRVIKGDGTTQRAYTSAIVACQAANDGLTAGRTWKEKILFIGDYTNITTPLLLDSNTIFQSLGRLKLANGANETIIENRTPVVTVGSQNTNIELIGGEYDGNKANNSSNYLINFEACKNIIVDGIYSHDAHLDGVSFNGVTGGLITNCRLDNNAAMGARVTGSAFHGVPGSDIQMIGNRADGNAINGLWMGGMSASYKMSNCTMVGNRAKTNTIAGLYIDWNVYNWTVSGNNAEDNGDGSTFGAGIWANGEANGTPYFGNFPGVIIGNTCYNNRNDGIDLTWAKDVKVTGNTCYKNKWHGISVIGSQRCNISNNDCIDNSQTTADTWNGINLASQTGTDAILYQVIDCTIKDNKCYDTGATAGAKFQKYGIAIAGTGYNNYIKNNYVRGNKSAGINTVDMSNCTDNDGFRVKTGRYYATSLTEATEGILQGAIRSYVGGGTIALSVTSAGAIMNYATAATTNDIVGGRFMAITERDLSPVFRCKYRLNITTNCTFVIGFHSDANSNPTTAYGTNPLTNKHGAILFYDPTISANYRIHNNDGQAAIVPTTTTTAVDTSAHELVIKLNTVGTPSLHVIIDDVPISAPLTAQMPGATTEMGVYWYLQTAANAAKNFDIWDVELKHLD